MPVKVRLPESEIEVKVPAAGVVAPIVVPFIVPPVTATELAFWVDIVPKPLISVFDSVTAPVRPATLVTKLVWSIFCQVAPLNSNQSPICQSVIPFKLVLPAVATM